VQVFGGRLLDFFDGDILLEISKKGTVSSRAGMGTGGYTLNVGKTSMPWSLHILGYYSQSTAPTLNTPLYSLVQVSNA
jgi:hypothetical protein